MLKVPVTTVIIEDDPMVLDINRHYVESIEGFQVVGTATSSGEGLELVSRLKPQLVILDIYLPDAHGLDTLQEIRSQQIPTDVILVTAARDVETIRTALRLGAVDYLVKPFRKERFCHTLESYRATCAKLQAKKALSQEEIDYLVKAQPAGSHSPEAKVGSPGRSPLAPRELPKGLAEITMKQILLYLTKSARALSAEELAQGIGISRVSARRYLDYLTHIGITQVEAQYGAVGRPLNRYCLCARASPPPGTLGASTLWALALGLALLALAGLAWVIFAQSFACAPRVVDGEQISPQRRVVIRFSHVVAENTPKGKAAQRFADLANQRLGNRVEVQVYPNSSLYKDGEEMEALLENKVQIIAPATSKLTTWFPQWQLFDLPFLFSSYEEIHRVMDGEVGKELYRLFSARGMLALAAWDNGFKGVSATRPLRQLEDFRGLTFRIMPSQALEAQFRQLGAQTLPLPFSEVYSALETGQAQGAENPPSNFYSKGFYQLQPYFTVSNHGYLGYVVLVNAAFWQGLPAELRQELEKIMAEVTVWERQIAGEENRKALEELKQAGVELIYLTPAEEEAWRQALQPVYQELALAIGRDLLGQTCQSIRETGTVRD